MDSEIAGTTQGANRLRNRRTATACCCMNESEASLEALRIYTEWRWDLLSRPFLTYRDISNSIDVMIERCKREVKNSRVLFQCLLRFDHAKNKLSEFTVDDEADMDTLFNEEFQSANPREVAGVCCRCLCEVPEYAPQEKTSEGLICIDCLIKES